MHAITHRQAIANNTSNLGKVILKSAANVPGMTPPRLPRRRLLSAAIATVTALTLAACGSNTETNTTDTRSISHAMGSTDVPSDPKRIVVIDSPHLDALVALGLKPVGATESAAGNGFPGYLRDKLDGTESVGRTEAPNIEAIAALRPDLIIGSKVRHEKIYDQLTAIAPTVFSVETGTNWKEQANITAAAVNKTDQMTSLLTELDNRAAEVGKKVGAADTTVSIVRFRATGFRLYGPQTFSGSVLTSMGFPIVEKQWNQYSMIETSLENFGEIDGKTAFYTQGANSTPAVEQVTARWGALPAVAANRAFAVEDETWMVGIGVIGAGKIIDDVERVLPAQ